MKKTFEVRLNITGGPQDEVTTAYAQFSIEGDGHSSAANLYVSIREFLTSPAGRHMLYPYSAPLSRSKG